MLLAVVAIIVAWCLCCRFGGTKSVHWERLVDRAPSEGGSNAVPGYGYDYGGGSSGYGASGGYGSPSGPPEAPLRSQWTAVGGEVFNENLQGLYSPSAGGQSPSQQAWGLHKPPPPVGQPRTPTEMRRGATEMTLGYAPDVARDIREMQHGWAASSPALAQPPGPGGWASPGSVALGAPGGSQPQGSSSLSAEALLASLAARMAPFDPGRVYDDADGNRDARLTRDEFGKVAVRWFGPTVSIRELDAVFAALDFDGNGTISRHELGEALLQRRS